MRIAAVPAEYNPFHTGHLFHLRRTAEELRPDAVVAVMSGNFTQRGDAAVAEKHLRATAAVRAGADLVLELPSYYAVNCAEKFAEGVLKTLSCFPCDVVLSFGSECGDIEKIRELSVRTHNETESQKKRIRAALDRGEPLVRARAEALGCAEDFTPNNVLALEYAHFAEKTGTELFTVRRETGYEDLSIGGEYASANALRNYILQGRLDEIRRFLPEYSLETLENCVFGEDLSGMLSYALSRTDRDALSRVCEVSEGLENRILRAAETNLSYGDLIAAVKSKRYTMARIKRVMLYVLFGLTRERAAALAAAPPYARVLACGRKGTVLLNMLGNGNLIVRESDLPKMPEAVKNAVRYESGTDRVYFAAAKRKTPFNCVFPD